MQRIHADELVSMGWTVCRFCDCSAVDKDGVYISVGILIKLLVHILLKKYCFIKKIFIGINVNEKRTSRQTKSYKYLFRLDINLCKHWAKTMFA